MHLSIRLITLALLSAGFTSATARGSEYYLSARLGYDHYSDLPLDIGPILGDLELDRGWGFGLAAGRNMGQSWRLELEAMSRRADSDALPALALEELNGRVQTRTVMLNVIADLSITGSAVTPFAGLGAGWASVEVDDVGNDFLRISGKDSGALGLQAFVGIAAPVSDTVSVTLDARYTYVRADDVSFDVGPGVPLDGETRVKMFGVVAGLHFDL